MSYRRKKKGKGKGDAVWPAKRTAGQCGLSGRDIEAGMLCLFLKCDGRDAEPAMQIIGRLNSDEKLENVTPDGRFFRSVPTGSHRCKRGTCQEIYDYWQRFCNAEHPENPGKMCRAPTGAVFKWQEGRPTGRVDSNGESELRWHDVKIWERVVIADEAVARGFHVPMRSDGQFRMTEAKPGERTVGHAHSVSSVPESPMMDVARAAMSDEELGIEPPAAGDADTLSQDDLDFLRSL